MPWIHVWIVLGFVAFVIVTSQIYDYRVETKKKTKPVRTVPPNKKPKEKKK